MRKLLIPVLALILSAVPGAADGKTDTLRVLCIGNDYSNDVVNRNLGELAAQDGVAIIAGNLSQDGCSLSDHHTNMTAGIPAYSYFKRNGTNDISCTKDVCMDYALLDEKWDVVTFQQDGGLAGLWTSYEPYLGDLVRHVRSVVGDGVRLMWMQGWAYTNDTLYPDFAIYGRNSSDMFKAIASASKQASEKYGFGIIPCGAAIQTLRSTYVAPSITSDGRHLNFIGRYTVSATFYAAITGHASRGEYKPEPLRDDIRVIADKAVAAAVAQPFDITWLVEYSSGEYRKKYVNMDPDRIPNYTLPDALTCADGKKVRNSRQWMSKRRGELIDLFSRYEYGFVPGRPEHLSFRILSQDSTALGGLATRREVRISYADDPDASFILLQYMPNGADGKVPVFLLPVFISNLAVSEDPRVSMYSPEDLERIAIGGCYTDRGSQKSRYPLEKIMRRGYGFAAVYYAHICTDNFTGWERGPFKYFYKPGQTFPAGDEWGAISAWAWALSRCMDYLQTDPSVDESRVAVAGHSRLGKTALWASANDQRFAMCISSCSGCCGAALSRRKFGENFSTIIADFPHWFCRNFWEYVDREDEFPVDQHELIALTAPRPIYISSGSEDLWADPVGEKMSLDAAAKVYSLFGPDAQSRIGYHMHDGPHGMRYDDWDHYLDFADKNFGTHPPVSSPVDKTESSSVTLAPGETLSLPENFVRTDVTLKASMQVNRFERIRLGLGPNCYCGGWLDITPDSYTYYDRYKIRIDTVGTSLKYSFDTVAISRTNWDGSALGRNVSVTINSHKGSADLRISSDGVDYRATVDRWWEGGIPFLTNLCSSPMAVTLSFERQNADRPVWFFADSYFSTRNKLRWPYYMKEEGYDNWMADHIPGGGSWELLKSFKHDLEFGTPKVAVWMLGMNDKSDQDGQPSAKWLECITEFISICREKGIEPVLTTVPTVPGRFHDCKTEWIRNSGCRYIDWYEACGTDSKGNWTEGYLHSDQVHPAEAGAEALWVSVKKSLPELSK